MNLREAEIFIGQQLASIYDESERHNIALLVIENITGFGKTDFLMNKHTALTLAQQESLQEHITRLLRHEPIQYIMQKAWFYEMELYVNENVLIPRPETEELVDWVIKDVKASGKDVFHKAATDADVTKQLKILDVGTGSGCMALALKKAMPKAEVWGCDISEEALNVARRNGADSDIRVDFQGVDFLDEAQQKLLPTVDVIVSNPPYIPLNQQSTMQQNVLNYEPHTALFVPDDDALIFYKAIAQFARKRLYSGGAIYMEINEDMSEAVVNLFTNYGCNHVEVKKDMQGKDRMAKVIL